MYSTPCSHTDYDLSLWLRGHRGILSIVWWKKVAQSRVGWVNYHHSILEAWITSWDLNATKDVSVSTVSVTFKISKSVFMNLVDKSSLQLATKSWEYEEVKRLWSQNMLETPTHARIVGSKNIAGPPWTSTWLSSTSLDPHHHHHHNHPLSVNSTVCIYGH